jgi:hypothetical protein
VALSVVSQQSALLLSRSYINNDVHERSLPCLQTLLNRRCCRHRHRQMKGHLHLRHCPGHRGSTCVILCPALRLFASRATSFLFPLTQDPNDPTTFPGYQAGLHSPDIPSQVTMSSNIGSRNTVANAQTTQPNAGGYHGHPIV